MQVPSITQLRELFGAEPVSIAEVALGQFLPLERWPAGEIEVTSEVAGRRAVVYLNPMKHSVAVDIYAPDLVASIAVGDVDVVFAAIDSGGRRAMKVNVGGGTCRTRITLRLRPDIGLRFDGTDHADTPISSRGPMSDTDAR